MQKYTQLKTYDVRLLNPTQKKLALFLAGIVANLAFAPFEFFPILLLSFPLFLLILETATSRKQAFWFGWWFGFGHFLAGFYWISNSLLVDADKFAWLIPFAAGGIPSVLAIYIGLAALFFHIITTRYQFPQLAKIIIFINLWLLTEFARNYLFTGFPWNLVGYSLLFNLPLAQIASLGGVFLASWFALLLAFLPLIFSNKKAFVALILITIVSYSWGAYRIDNSNMQQINKTVKLIQPNIKQTLTWDEKTARADFQTNLDLMKSGKQADYYIWAEAAGVYHLNRSREALYALQDATPAGSLTIVGADRTEGYTREDYKAWNSMYVISPRKIEAIYDKQHLVPFGEYVPFSKILPLEKITYGMADFSSGQGERLINIDGLRALPLICYEAIFTDYILPTRAKVEIKPDLIINITNDAWFGNSTGPYQHLAMTRLRAIETGIPTLRTAKSGISAVIDAFGNIINSLGLNQKGAVFSDIPAKLSNPTIYSQYRLLLILTILVSGSIITTFFRRT